MGNGVSPLGPPLIFTAGPEPQEEVKETGKIDESKGKEPKADTQPPVQRKDKPSVADTSAPKLEQRLNGTARQAELQAKLPNKGIDSMKASGQILDNTKLSNEAKIAQLQKMIVKTDKTEFANFMAKFPNFSTAEKELIHSAITESPDIMRRVAGELTQSQQLTVIWNGIMYPLPGKSDKAEIARQERVDKGIAAWMTNTDPDTLSKALDGKSIDIRASSKLFGTLAANPHLIMKMGHDGKLIGDQLEAATNLMNMVYSPQTPPGSVSRKDIEAAAASLILRNIEEEARRERFRRAE